MKTNSRFTKVAVATGLIVCSGAAVLGLTGFASAQQAGNRTAQVASVTNDTTNSDGAALDGDVEAQAAPFADDHADRPSPLTVAAKAIGISESELLTQLKAGKSVADVAKANNVDLADVKAAILADLKAHFDSEVASGEHTQAEADQMIAQMTADLDTRLSTPGLPMGGPEGRGPGGHGAGRFMTDALAKVLKLSTTELRTQLMSGKSIADVAKAQDVDIADVKDVLVADFKAHLADEVKSGEHTQAEADQKLADFKTRLDDMVNRVGPAGGPGMGGRHGHGHGHGHGFGGPGGDHDGDGPMDAPSAQGTSAQA
jgi:hypothetical protein